MSPRHLRRNLYLLTFSRVPNLIQLTLGRAAVAEWSKALLVRENKRKLKDRFSCLKVAQALGKVATELST